jgi:hypothetical protein
MMSEAVIATRGWPNWAKRLIVWIGVPTGILLSAEAFLGALGEFGGHVKSACEATGYCATEKSAPPMIPNYTSPWVDGGHNASEFCGPHAQHYQAIYPAFNVTWRVLGEGRDKDWRGHVTYQYNCAFEATVK